jgi:hypothetical protein
LPGTCMSQPNLDEFHLESGGLDGSAECAKGLLHSPGRAALGKLMEVQRLSIFAGSTLASSSCWGTGCARIRVNGVKTHVSSCFSAFLQNDPADLLPSSRYSPTLWAGCPSRSGLSSLAGLRLTPSRVLASYVVPDHGVGRSHPDLTPEPVRRGTHGASPDLFSIACQHRSRNIIRKACR